MKIIIIVLFSLSAFASIAQKEIKVGDVKNHVGNIVKICDKIYGGKFLEKDTLTLLNVGGNYPDAPLTIVIRPRTRKEFKTDPISYYKGQQVCITGKIELFKNKPQIVITDKNQIIEYINDHPDKEPN